MPRKPLPENQLPQPIAALKGLRKNSPHVKRSITEKEAEERKAKKRKQEAKKARKKYLKKAARPDGSLIPVKERGKPQKDHPRGTTGSTPTMSLAWFRDYLTQPLDVMLSKPRSQMSAIEAITVEAVRLAIDTRGEETVTEAIKEAGVGRGRGAVSVKEGMRHILGGDAAARFFSTPEDRLKAIKHLHAYQLGQAPGTLDLKNNGGSFEPPITGPLDVEVVLTRADGTKSKLQRLDQMAQHPDTVEEEAREIEEDEGPGADDEREDERPFDSCDPTKPDSVLG